MEFKFNDRVKIISGFYKGQAGYVVEISGPSLYSVELNNCSRTEKYRNLVILESACNLEIIKKLSYDDFVKKLNEEIG
jgi:ribosomal protein L24